ncbi:MAG: hypothetical protein NXY57DRAFT_1018444 [Lentinula lateritia]|nr:MAG: hypothetical protein NXY57DRAFT_1018444 [Lentinula lateritia]
MYPRPILKARLSSFTQRSPASASPSSSFHNPFPFYSGLHTPHVHFPPTPVIASTQPTHSSSTYDRTAITVSPNSCELPERGGRCYSPSYATHAPRVTVNSYFDPLAGKACDTASYDTGTPPLLIPDLSSSSSSESEDSDAYGSPLFSPPNIPFSYSTHTSNCSIPSTFSQEEFVHAFSFLPHPPSQVKDDVHRRPKLVHKQQFWKRRKSCEPLTSSSRYDRGDSAFQEGSLDGCLGGF